MEARDWPTLEGTGQKKVKVKADHRWYILLRHSAFFPPEHNFSGDIAVEIPQIENAQACTTKEKRKVKGGRRIRNISHAGLLSAAA